MPTANGITKTECQADARLIEAIHREADYMAELTASFLAARGFPLCGEAGDEKVEDGDGPHVRRAKVFLLNLAAELRLCQWEQAGLRRYLPGTLPPSTVAFRTLVPPDDVGSTEESSGRTELWSQVFSTWLERFCRGSRATIGVDVVLRLDDLSVDEFLDAMADFLWEHRHLALPEGDEK